MNPAFILGVAIFSATLSSAYLVPMSRRDLTKRELSGISFWSLLTSVSWAYFYYLTH